VSVRVAVRRPCRRCVAARHVVVRQRQPGPLATHRGLSPGTQHLAFHYWHIGIAPTRSSQLQNADA